MRQARHRRAATAAAAGQGGRNGAGRMNGHEMGKSGQGVEEMGSEREDAGLGVGGGGMGEVRRMGVGVERMGEEEKKLWERRGRKNKGVRQEHEELRMGERGEGIREEENGLDRREMDATDCEDV